VRRCLAFCRSCNRVEFTWEAGPFFWRCTECLALIPRELSSGDERKPPGKRAENEIWTVSTD
jgi:hypothetical protein